MSAHGEHGVRGRRARYPDRRDGSRSHARRAHRGAKVHNRNLEADAFQAGPVGIVEAATNDYLSEVSLFSTTTIFGTPLDIALSEIALECFYPADAATVEILRSLK